MYRIGIFCLKAPYVGKTSIACHTNVVHRADSTTTTTATATMRTTTTAVPKPVGARYRYYLFTKPADNNHPYAINRSITHQLPTAT